jgi:hypothetical protein
MNSLLLPQRLGRAITVFGYVFLASAFALEPFGYCYTIDPDTHGLTIDAVEHRSFQKQRRNYMKSSSLSLPAAPTERTFSGPTSIAAKELLEE